MATRLPSLSHRFIAALMSVVLVIVGGFAVTAIHINKTHLESDLTQHLAETADLAAKGLVTPLWNIDEKTTAAILSALLSSADMAYLNLSTEDGEISRHADPAFADNSLEFFESSPDFLVTRAEVSREGTTLGTLDLAVSRARIESELRLNIAGTVALTALLLAAIALVSIVVSRRYIVGPLSHLQRSAAMIAGGELDATIDIERDDEVGRLAGDLNTMRESIRRLIGALRESNQSLEESNRTLEDRVAERTARLEEQNAIVQLNQHITRAANEASTATEALGFALDQICKFTGWPVGHVYLLADDDSGDVVSSGIWHVVDTTRFETLRQVTNGTRWGPSPGLVGGVLAGGQPRWITDVTTDPDFARAKLAEDIGVQAAFAFPVLVGREVVAVLEFFLDRPEQPNQELMELVGQVGTQLGRVVERARAEQQLHRAKDAADADRDRAERALADLSVAQQDLVRTNADLTQAERAAQESQQRLVDAIESISEGFALYDADDTLVLCNTRYRELLYGGSGLHIEIGNRFETMVRHVVAEGLIPAATDDAEAWIQNRLEQHRNPGAPQLQHRSDGRWIQIGERRSAGGDTVAIYSDLTDLKQREADLARANGEILLLNERLKTENIRLGAELDVTRRLQRMLLPKADELRAVPGLEIAGYMDPAEEVGGDYYDVLQRDGRVKIGIGDVTGHGLESGMVMLMTQMAVRTLLNSGETDTGRFLDVLNRTVFDNVRRMGTDKNLTLALLDYADGEVKLSGQHEQLIVMRQGGRIELLDTVDLGFPIGLEREISDFIDHTSIVLDPGDGIVLFTDGVTEAESPQGELYGLDRLCGVASAHWLQSAEAIKEAVVADLRRHIAGHEVYDDITLLVAKQRGGPTSDVVSEAKGGLR
jgi:serine phosphatase RsbU (regulator of sigma subunit)/GAF domain-containing protein/HAMP domain-containing protein